MSVVTRLRYRAARKPLLRAPVVWLRHRGLAGTDVMLASYPRSGNTWLRFVLADVLAESSSFDNIQGLIPEIGIHGGARSLLPNGGRLIKTHEAYRRDYRRAIYIVRDVRDVLLSNFRRETLDDLIGPLNLDLYVANFLAGKMTRYGSWQSHVSGWLDSPLASKGDLLILRYEDMRKELEPVLIRVLDFLGVPPHSESIRSACRNNTIDRMRMKEDFANRLPKSLSEQGRWIERGALGAWHDELTKEQMQHVATDVGPTLARLGYPAKALTDRDQLASGSFPEVRPYRDFLRENSETGAPSPAVRSRVGGWVASTSSWYRY